MATKPLLIADPQSQKKTHHPVACVFEHLSHIEESLLDSSKYEPAGWGPLSVPFSAEPNYSYPLVAQGLSNRFMWKSVNYEGSQIGLLEPAAPLNQVWAVESAWPSLPLALSGFYLGPPRRQIGAFEGLIPQTAGVAAVLIGDSFFEAFRRLEELRKLNDGWDGERAVALNPESINMASSLIKLLLDEHPDRPDLLPDISPEPDGGVLLQWELKGKELWVFADTNRYRSQQWDDEAQFRGLASTWQQPRQLLELVDWIAR
jgi:hypothetical protein